LLIYIEAQIIVAEPDVPILDAAIWKFTSAAPATTTDEERIGGLGTD
jgi:hypothetical protein